jgi:outer membrane protein TolC
LAELEESVLSALTDRSQRALTLNLLIGDPTGAGIAASDAPAEPAAADQNVGVLVAQAVQASPEVAQLEANVALSREQKKIAGESLRPRLDLDASLSVAGLGDQRVPPAFEQFGGLDAVGAHVGLTFEAPLDDTRRQAQVASAGLAQRISEKQLEATRQRLQNDVQSSYTVQSAAFERLRVTRETVRVAERQTEAERQRFQAGASIAIQVQQAEDSLRQAELRFERARVDWTLAEIDLAHLSGRLLERYDGGVRKLRAAGG